MTQIPFDICLCSYHTLTTSLEIEKNMADDERRGSKRSRFDQTEPEPKRTSRFDRRSRSPASKQSDTRRSRSPLSVKSPLSPGALGAKSDPAAAAGKWRADQFHSISLMVAAAAAARINAQIQAKKGIQHVDVPPIRSVSITGFSSRGCRLLGYSRLKVQSQSLRHQVLRRGRALAI